MVRGLEHNVKATELLIVASAYNLRLNMFLILIFCAFLKSSIYILLNVLKILMFYLRYQN